MTNKLFIKLIVTLFTVIGVNCNAKSASYIVTNTGDSGAGSLREAITQANANAGADSVIFNIPVSDAGYNSQHHVWTINLSSALPMVQNPYTVIDAGTQAAFAGVDNPAGPEVKLDGAGYLDNAFTLVAMNNVIKGFIISNFINGIVVYGSYGTDNTIEDCYIGTNETGTQAVPNSVGIIVLASAHDNLIKNCLISGNTTLGVYVKHSNNNEIIGNKIGTDITGMYAISNESGVYMDSASYNVVGGMLEAERNLISGNVSAGVMIAGRNSTENIIQNNYIGTNITGTDRIPNLYGVSISRAYANIVGRNNLISGNTDIGVLLTGKHTNNNVIKGNLIGTDITGTQLLDNHKGIIIKSLANSNVIGGSTPEDRNIISGNLEIGIYIEAADSNVTIGNYIGTDITGTQKVAIPYVNPEVEYLDSLVQGNGIEFNSTAKHNILGGYEYGERNIISGHKVYGVVYYGNCSYNHLYNNFIGTDVTSKISIPNATGICFDCASNHNDVIDCVISGNLSYGLFYVTRGTEYNRFFGNMVGVDSSGTVAVPNDIGIVVSTGTRYNIIGGVEPEKANVFSGNRLSGMMVTNGLTEYNQIIGNYFGTDITGTQPIPNKYGITLATLTKHNNIEKNIICANESSGIIIYENADSNIVVDNRIGIDANGNPLGNNSGGIFIDQGAAYNVIGSPEQPNIIAYNEAGGILLKHNLTQSNRISGNSIYENNGLGIDIFPFGVVNNNDNADWDEGVAQLQNFPVIEEAVKDINNGNIRISGTIDTQIPGMTEIEVFKASADATGYGQGQLYLGSVVPSATGEWTLYSDLIDEGDAVTAVCISQSDNTSEFCENFSDIVLSDEEIGYTETSVSFYPNPCKEKLFVSLQCEHESVNVEIVDITGKQVFRTVKNCTGKGFDINLKKHGISQAGKYFIRIYNTNLDITESVVIY